MRIADETEKKEITTVIMNPRRVWVGNRETTHIDIHDHDALPAITRRQYGCCHAHREKVQGPFRPPCVGQSDRAHVYALRAQRRGSIEVGPIVGILQRLHEH